MKEKIKKKKTISWCQCSRNVPQIKSGSRSYDTGKICCKCSGKIFEEEAKN